MRQGDIMRWSQERRFGFIRPDDGGQGLWFNAGSLCNPEELGDLAAGVRVEYLPGQTPRGPASFHVRILPDVPAAA